MKLEFYDYKTAKKMPSYPSVENYVLYLPDPGDYVKLPAYMYESKLYKVIERSFDYCKNKIKIFVSEAE